ncbi:MAG TPA: peptidylprolyl isomerase, partial [Gammaproteobacteria bacterium]
SEESDLIDIKVRRYREELLAEAYLRANAKPSVPTDAEISDYYAKHPELFGAAPVRSYEILQSKSGLNAEQAAKLLQFLTTAKQQRDWRAYAAQLKNQGQPVIYLQGRSDGPALSPRLLQVINGLSAGQVSDVFYLDKQPHLLRVKAIETPPARPLAEVRVEVRKIMAVQRMKESIKQIAQQILDKSDVVYLTPESRD